MADQVVTVAPPANVSVMHKVSNTTLLVLIVGGWLLLRKLK